MTKYVERKEVADFCSVCDFYEPEKPCKIVREVDQARYVNRDWCGWANVGGANINITANSLEFIFPDLKKVSVSRGDEERIKSTIEKWKEAYAKERN